MPKARQQYSPGVWTTSNHESRFQPKVVSGSRPETPTRAEQACDGSSVIGRERFLALEACRKPLRPTSFQVLRNVVVVLA